LEISGNLETHANSTAVLNEYAAICSDLVGRSKLIDHDIIEERLLGVPISPPTNTTNPPADNIFATTETVNVLPDVPFSTTTLASWQSNDPHTRDIINAVKSDTPARNTRSATKDTDNFVLSDGFLRQNDKGHLSIVRLKTQSQQVIGGITTIS
jgi:hypothetical protein